MKERVDDERIEGFLDSLWHPTPSLAQRVVAAHFIRAHREAIDAYINRRISLSGASYGTAVWAKKTHRLLQKHQKGPKGYSFNANRGTLVTHYAAPARTFRLSGAGRQSLTFVSRRPPVILAGYVVACLCIVAILGMGFVVKNTLQEAIDRCVARIMHVPEE